MIGQTISHYRILSKIGEGGMGIVYKAHDTTLDRDIALKFLRPDTVASAGDLERILHEARAAARLKNPHIATIYDCDSVSDSSTHTSRTFIAMEFVEGETLRAIVRRGPLPVRRAVDLVLQLTDALAAAHDRGIIHRDLKPDNIIVQPDGSLKILDFGLARLSGESTIVRTGIVAGSAAYMSPEQIQGLAIDRRSDLFSLGVVFYEMLTGKKPFAAEYDNALFYMIINTEPEQLQTSVPDMPEDTAAIVLRLLRKDPAKRFQSAAEVNRALGGLATFAGGSAPRYWMESLRRMNPRTLAAVVAVCLMLVALLIPSARRWIGNIRFTPARSAEIRCAVLPFNLSPDDRSDSLFRDGLVDIITSKLYSLRQFDPGLRVEPYDQMQQEGIASITDAQRLAGATHVISGTVHSTPGEIHIDLKLVETASGKILRSEEIVSNREQLASFEPALMTDLLSFFGISVPDDQIPRVSAAGTHDPVAYALYVNARGCLVNFDLRRNVDSGIVLLRRALERDSAFAGAVASLGEAYLRKFGHTRNPEDVDNAIMYCNNAIELDKDLRQVHYTEGLLYKTLGRYDDAVREFEMLLATDRGNSDVYRELAEVYEKKGFQKTAEQTYKKAISADSGYWAGYKALGVYYYVHGRYEDAVAQFARVTALLPNSPFAFSNLGGVYQVMGNRQKAREMYARSLEIQPNEVVYNNLGVLYFYDGMYAEAAGAYAKAVVFNRQDYRIWGNLGSAYYWSGRHREKAMAAYDTAVGLAEKQFAINPLDRRLMAELGGYYVMVGRKQEARELLRRALAGNPDDKDVVGEAAMNLELLGERAEAIRTIGAALKMGYPLEDFEIFPGLAGLRQDSRYKSLIRGYKQHP